MTWQAEPWSSSMGPHQSWGAGTMSYSQCQQVKDTVCPRILPQRNVIKHLSPQVCITLAALGCTRCHLQFCLCSVFLFNPSQSSKTKEDLGLASRRLSNWYFSMTGSWLPGSSCSEEPWPVVWQTVVPWRDSLFLYPIPATVEQFGKLPMVPELGSLAQSHPHAHSVTILPDDAQPVFSCCGYLCGYPTGVLLSELNLRFIRFFRILHDNSRPPVANYFPSVNTVTGTEALMKD